MTCDVQQLLEDGKCFAAMSDSLHDAALLALWCQVAEGLAALADGP